MGTNFYIRLTVRSRDQKKAINYLKSVDYDYVNPKYVSIHLGKRSVGWKFLFNANMGLFYELSREGISEFVKENHSKIYDEYGRCFSLEDFWEDEIKDFLSKGYDLKSYYEEQRKRGDPEYVYTIFYHPEWSLKYNPNKHGEFYNNGLRFTTSNSFS